MHDRKASSTKITGGAAPSLSVLYTRYAGWDRKYHLRLRRVAWRGRSAITVIATLGIRIKSDMINNINMCVPFNSQYEIGLSQTSQRKI